MSYLEHDHSAESIRHRLSEDPKSSYVQDWVYGGIDGAITTFAIVASAIGAGFSSTVVLIMGAANLLADGFSMAAGNYSATKTQSDELEHIKAMEKRHIKMIPEGEKEEIRQIYQQKGFSGEILEEIVETITSDEELWIDTMILEEFGISPIKRSPIYAAFMTFFAFIVCGFVPMIPFIFNIPNSFYIAVFLTSIVFFTIGAMKSKWSTAKWYISGLEILVLGLGAATIAYLIGYFISDWTGININGH